MDFLSELFVFLVAALIAVPLLNRLGLSSVIGYLVAGILIGPSGLHLIADTERVLHFSEIGVVLLLFVIGLELQPRRLWVMRHQVFGLGSAQVLSLSVVLGALLYLLGLPLGTAAIIGFALALSSTAFVLQLLAERKELNHAHGRAAFGVLLLQDVAVIPAIVLLTAAGGSDAAHGDLSWLSLGLIVGLILAARYLLKPLLKLIAGTGINELFIAAGLAVVCGAALAMQSAGLSMALGAFIAGMLVADSEFRHQLETDIMPFKGLLLGLFFIAVGMTANVGLLLESPVLIIGLALGLVAIKFFVFIPIAMIFRLHRSDAIKTSAVLSQGGEFAFVLLTIAASSSLINTQILETTILVVTLSMASTPFFMMALQKFTGKIGDKREFDQVADDESPIIIAGFGRFGQIIGRILSANGQGFTALEANPGQVDFVREFGNEVYYGDATRLDLLQNAGVANARAVVLALRDIETSSKIAAILRDLYPEVKIFARAYNRQHEITLRNLGVQYVIRESLLSSLDLTRNLFDSLGLDHSAVDVFRDHDAQTLDRQAAVVQDVKAFRQTTREAQEELRSLFAED